MAIFPNDIEPGYFLGRPIFLDNCSLSFLSKNETAFAGTVNLCREGFLYIDPITKLEFLRSKYVPEQYKLAKEFIENEDIFTIAEDHFQIFEKVRTNALFLSFLYSQNRVNSAAIGDLLLAGRAILYKNSLIITENRKDFPLFLFDTIGVINYEEPTTGKIRAHSIIDFNEENFNQARKQLAEVKSPKAH